MTRDEALEYIHEHSRDYATETWGRDRSGKGWVCPLCGSGSHNDGTGITTRDGVHFTCWAGCFTNVDMIDVIGLVQNIPELDHAAKFEAARREFGIAVDNPLEGEAAKGLSLFFLEANRHLGDTDYHRGISLETLNRFKVGYVEKWRHPKCSQVVSVSPRLIIPLSPNCYLARDTRPDLTLEQEKYKKQLVGSRGGALFNGDALKDAREPVFVTEGELDAMSVIDVGSEAITAGSAALWRNVLEAVKANPQPYPVIVALDSDETGGARSRDLEGAFEAEGIAFIEYVPPMGCKDANEALMKDRAVFADSIRAAVERAMKLRDEQPNEEDEARQEYVSAMSASVSLRVLADRVKSGEETPCFPTGFHTLDRILDGGLRSGLYVLGAIQSLGKTAFCMQIMDNIAESGKDVLVFSLEMSREELIARSLSRITYELSRNTGKPVLRAYDTAEVLSGRFHERDGEEGKRCVMDAITEYSRYSDRVFIFEGVGDVTVEQVREMTQRHIRLTGRRPVVLCDYLQIMPTVNARNRTEKQNVDYNVVALKRMSRDLSIPVVAISSFNRQNYLEPLNPGAFKESGAIEYSADVLMGIQYQGMEYQLGDEKESQRVRRVAALIRDWEKRGKAGKPQGLHLKVMKNRTGYRDSVCLSYYPAFNFFECDVDADDRTRKEGEMWERSVEDEIRATGRGTRAR